MATSRSSGLIPFPRKERTPPLDFTAEQFHR
ncbi:MAG TPA: hypothetical protein EYQ08_01015 [Planctomycetes bacterium]|nr:hypothetical protein [Planctomycetota bacterium]HIK82637.1 hypothetical protein [Planctomycetota bacterium]